MNLVMGNEKMAVKNSYIWNMVAAGVNASEAIFILMVATRTVGLADAGILTFAFTIANLMMTVGKFGIRNFQVTDSNNEFSWGEYLTSRYITMVAMVVCLLGYLMISSVVNHYTVQKSLIILGISLLYAVESSEDVFWGLFQKKGRLDVGARIFSFRWLGTIAVLCVGLIVTKNTVLSVYFAFAVELILEFVLLRMAGTLYRGESKSFSWKKVFSLLKQCTPLFVSVCASLYITNASKYAIDACLPDTVQACYGFVAMPIFVIGLLNSIIYEPILVLMAQEWNEGAIEKFKARIGKQCIIILILAAVCLLGAYLLGIPVLSILYASDLTDYKFELMTLLVGGAWLSFAGFFTAVLTIMRKQKSLAAGYLGVAIIALALTTPVVRRYNVEGAAVINMVWTLLLAVDFGLVMIWNIRAKQ